MYGTLLILQLNVFSTCILTNLHRFQGVIEIFNLMHLWRQTFLHSTGDMSGCTDKGQTPR